MSINASKEFHNNGALDTFRRSFTLRRFSNRSSLNSKTDESITDTFEQSLIDTEKSSRLINGTQTLGRSRRLIKLLQPTSPSSLEEVKKNFWGNEAINENTSKGPHLENRESLVKTLKRNVNIFLINLKKPEEIDAYSQKAKNFFQNSKYKESKKIFKDLLGIESQKSESSLYLAAIYLIEKNGCKAKEQLKGLTTCYLTIVMNEHAEHLLNSGKEDTFFPKIGFYEVKIATEDEKVIIGKLFDLFKKNTPA